MDSGTSCRRSIGGHARGDSGTSEDSQNLKKHFGVAHPSIFDIGYVGRMTKPRIRVTLVIMDVLDVIMSAPEDDPTWGLRICEATGHGPGTVYPALDRLMKAEWIDDRWENPVPADRPRRRFYAITSVGRAGYTNALEQRASRRVAWATPGAPAGGVA